MRRMVLTFVAVALLAGTVAAEEEQRSPRLEDLVPGHSFALVSVNDVPALRAQLSRTALMKLWREPEVQQFLAPALEMLGTQMAKAEKKLGHPIAGLLDFLDGQVALAVVEFDPLYGGVVPDLVLLADLGPKRAEFEKMHADALRRAGNRARVSELTHHGTTFQVIRLGGGFELSVAYLGDSIVLTTRRDRMRKVIDANAGGIDAPLSANPVYRAVRSRTGKGAFLSAFVNTNAILEHFGELLDPGQWHALEVSGLSGIEGIGASSSFVAEGVRDTLYVHAPGEKRGLLALAYTSPGDGTALLSRVPANAFYATSGRVNLDAVLSLVLETLGEFDPGMQDQAYGKLAEADRVLGLSLREDLLQAVGEEFAAYAAMPDGGGLVPDLVFLARPRDPERLSSSIFRLVERLKAHLADDGRLVVHPRKMQYMGRTIYYLHVAHRWGDPVPVTPCFVLDDGVLAAALLPQALKDFVARGADAPSILAGPDFARVRKGLPESLMSIEYVDLQAAFRILYGTLVPVAQAVAKDAKIPLDPALLPRTETVARHLFGAAWGAQADEQGVMLHAYSPGGLGPVILGLAVPAMFLAGGGHAGAAAIAVPPAPVPPERPAADGASTRARLEEIYSGLLFYFLERGDDYPPDLGALVTAKILDAGVLFRPGDPEGRVTGSGPRSAFEYVGAGVGRLMENQGKAVWVYDRPAAGQARWVLFADGSIERVPEAKFQVLLEATKKRIAK